MDSVKVDIYVVNFAGISEAAHQMTAEDCFDLAALAYSNKRIVTMLEWLNEAVRILTTKGMEDRVGNITFLDVYEHLSWAHYLVSLYTYFLIVFYWTSSHKMFQSMGTDISVVRKETTACLIDHTSTLSAPTLLSNYILLGGFFEIQGDILPVLKVLIQKYE